MFIKITFLQVKTFFLATLFSLLSWSNGYAQTATAPAGAGTSADPYQIATLENLVWLQVETNAGNNFSDNKYFKQTADIDLISIPNWTPIGNTASSSESNKWFRGNYDGGNFKISNLTIDRPNDDVQGLFGWVEGSGTNTNKTNWTKLENVRLENVNVRGNDRVGGIVGFIKRARLENSSAIGNVRASRERVGGLVGRSDPADLDNQLVFIGEVEGGIVTSSGLGSAVGIGGIVGRSSNVSNVSVAYVRGTVRGNRAGGIVGSTSTINSNFSEMYAAVSVVAGSGQTAGGAIVGRIESTGDVINNSVYWDNSLFSSAYGLIVGGHPLGNRNAIARSTAQMQGSSAETNMNNLDWTTSGPWRTVTLPTDDYPVFQWQLGDEISIAGQVTAANKSDLENITVRAQVGDVTFTDLTTTTDALGNYSFNAYSVPTQRVFARTTDDDGLPIGASVNGPWTTSQTGINLDLQPRSLSISSAANSGWIKDGNEILAVEAGAVLNVNTLRDELLAGDVTVVAGVDVVFDANLSPALTAARTLTLRSGGDILFEPESKIEPTGEALNLVVWSDITGNEQGGVLFDRASEIVTNNGHLWIGGGSGTATWNGLTVGDSYAMGLSTPASGDNNPRGGINFLGKGVNSGTGDIYMNGKANITGFRFGIGLRFNRHSSSEPNVSIQGNNITLKGAGSPNADNSSANNNRGNWGVGIEYTNILADGLIEIEGLGGGQNVNLPTSGNGQNHGVRMDNNSSIETTGSGDINITGLGGTPAGTTDNDGLRIDGGTIRVNTGTLSLHGTAGTNSNSEDIHYANGVSESRNPSNNLTNGNIELTANSLNMGSGVRYRSTDGQLSLQTRTATTTIGIAGASGTLLLSSTLFSTNFEPGFSNIIIGSENQTGNISVNAFNLQDNMTLLTSGTLTLGGKPVLGSNNVTLGEAITTIDVGSPANYFQTTDTGKVIRNIATGTGRLFPIGNSNYNPVTIENKNAVDDFSVRVIDDVFLNGFTGPSIETPHVKVTWDINKTNPGNTAGVDFEFQWNASQEFGSPASFELNHHNGSNWEFAAGTSGTVTGTPKTMTHTGYTGTFSPFAISESGSPLPVEFLGMQYDCMDQQGVSLTWQTASELNAKHFEVMRSEDGFTWEQIGTVAATGTTNQLSEYQFVDEQPSRASLRYYQLKQVDFDGVFEWLPIISVNCEAEGENYLLYPNPAQDRVNLSFNSKRSGVASVQLMDATGRIVSTNTYPVKLGNNLLLIDAEHLNNGWYTVVIDNGTPKTLKLVINK